MLNIFLLEDEEIQLEILSEYINKFFSKDNIEYKITKFKSGEDLLKEYLKKDIKVDIVFTDVGLKGISGIDVASQIRKFDNTVVIIFITCFTNYFQEGYKVKAFRYLLKPLKYKDLEDTLNDYFIEMAKNKLLIEFKSEGKSKIIDYRDILCIESIGRDIKIHTKYESFFTNTKLKEIEHLINSKIFFRCHKSFIINLLEVNSCFDNEVTIGDRRIKVPISHRKLNAFKQNITSILCEDI